MGHRKECIDRTPYFGFRLEHVKCFIGSGMPRSSKVSPPVQRLFVLGCVLTAYLTDAHIRISAEKRFQIGVTSPGTITVYRLTKYAMVK